MKVEIFIWNGDDHEQMQFEVDKTDTNYSLATAAQFRMTSFTLISHKHIRIFCETDEIQQERVDDFRTMLESNLEEANQEAKKANSALNAIRTILNLADRNS